MIRPWLRNLSLWFRHVPGYHSYWTAPLDTVVLSDFELVSLLASALYYRSHSGPICLVTDRRGIDYLNGLKLTALYDKVIELKVDPAINPKIFWAAGKVYAHRAMPTPSVSIDIDAIVWQPVHHTFKSHAGVALHTEPTDWPPYSQRWSEIRGPWSSVDLRTVDPVNTGILAILDEKFKEQYVSASISFMTQFSLANPGHGAAKQGPSYVDEMVFAEQMMLSLMAKKANVSLGNISGYDRYSDHMVENRKVTHLWNSKRGYRDHTRAREAFVHSMIDGLLRDFPESRKFIASSGIATMAIRDPNAGAVRYSKPGEWVLPGEEVEYL